MEDFDLKIFNKMKDKRGISDVIATVLIILVTIVAAGTFAAFLIPWIQKTTGEATSCFDVQGKISFVQDSSCYFIKEGEESYTKVRVKFGKINISEMNFYVPIDNEVRAILIKEGAEVSEPEYPVKILMIKDGEKEILGLPPSNGERTYKFKNAVLKSIKVAAVINEKTCDIIDTDLDRCRSG